MVVSLSQFRFITLVCYCFGYSDLILLLMAPLGPLFQSSFTIGLACPVQSAEPRKKRYLYHVGTFLGFLNFVKPLQTCFLQIPKAIWYKQRWALDFVSSCHIY